MRRPDADSMASEPRCGFCGILWRTLWNGQTADRALQQRAWDDRDQGLQIRTSRTEERLRNVGWNRLPNPPRAHDTCQRYGRLRQAVATGGGLPFLALALMKGEAVEKVIHETASLVGERPWGVGILGFVPEQLRQEQMAAISKAPPPFCIVAGGRPSQARQLEALGTATFLHVPSPGLLELFLKDGARRFIFEGRECGGHIGPRTSLLLWEQQLDILGAQSDLSGVTAIFAGGIHDARSAAIVSLMAARPQS